MSGRQPANQATNLGRPPNGVCHNYWRSGQCRFGATCKFSHERPGQPALQAGPRSPVDTNSRRTMGLNPFSNNQTGASNELRDAPIDAAQANQYLNRFCSPDGTLKTAAQVKLMLRVLNGVASEKSGWSADDRQSVLDRVCTDNGCMRLQEILTWKEITTSPNPPPGALSFQCGFIHALSLFACKAVIASTMRQRANKLYALINSEYRGIALEVIASMDTLVGAAAFENQTSPDSKEMPFGSILETLLALLKEYVERFPTAPMDHPNMKDLPNHLRRWFTTWSSSSTDPERDPRQATKIHKDIDRLTLIVNRDESKPPAQMNLGSQQLTVEDQQRALQPSAVQLSIIHRVYQAPGGRHDNDHASIADISITPTQEELRSTMSSFVPSTLHNAPHHLPMYSMERLLDIQFRLLREEFVYPIKAATNLVLQDLKSNSPQTTLHPILKEKGGRYKGQMERDSIFFSVYTNVELGNISADRRGLSVTLTFDTPPGNGRSKKAAEREAYWKVVGRKRLGMGGFIALMWNKEEIHLGLITSRTEDLIESSKANNTRISIKVSFFGSDIEYRALAKEAMKASKPRGGPQSQHLLLEIQILYEASRPFLEALKGEPTNMPFAQYLKQEEDGALSKIAIDSPNYTVAPDFSWDLSSLFNPPLAGLSMRVDETRSVALARHYLTTHGKSRLDPSQADAIISCLKNEVALIQGPPGTGKSYTAIQLLRVLISNNITNILMIAFTNHALDHLLESVLDAGITERIVRLGSRSQSERLQGYTLDKLEKFHTDFLRRGVGTAFGAMKQAEEIFNQFVERVKTGQETDSEDLETHLELNYPEHHEAITLPPDQVQERLAEYPTGFSRLYQLWKDAKDLQRGGTRRSRPLGTLLKTPAVWGMSAEERKQLSQKWDKESTEAQIQTRLASFENLKKNYCEAREAFEDASMMRRLEALKTADIIGCTTTGAARVLHLLKSLQPKIVLVEEAGQVLEAHSLATLVPSVEHLIMIGDPQQLRPSINTYAFASENPHGGQLYKFDQSLMERLASSGLPMSQLTIQRRMRPAVSNLIRRCLYPNLQDHESVKGRPSIRGMAKDIWFFHHTNKEGGGGDDNVSKCNSFEVEMVKSLVLFFLRQGIYNKPDSIVVLCTYLGQLTKIREALASCKLSVILDERDEDTLLEQEGKDGVEPTAESAEIDVSKQIRIRSVDNFQGEEADIIILSLVRNPGEGRGGIGFLKSSNRTNVALSRARHGMYVLGHGEALEAGGGIWSTVIDEFRQQDSYGPAFPFACYRHPHDVQWLSDPKAIDMLFSDGRCLLPCTTKLKCGHACPSKCHPDDESHHNTRCLEPCSKLCRLGHPCGRMCYEECACDFEVSSVRLPCGHHARNVPCAVALQPKTIVCKTVVDKKLPTCGHSINLPCHKEITNELCTMPCGKPCPLGHPCGRMCYEECACDLEVSSVRLPCGHHERNVPCIVARQPKTIVCNVVVGKRFPTCGHSIKLPCHKEITHELCTMPCSKLCPLGHPCGQICYEECACDFEVSSVQLPCGHHERNVPCAVARQPKTIVCKTVVGKKFPTCEHSINLPCYKEITHELCTMPCDKEMDCCSKKCKGSCHACQRLHPRRKRHVPHPCGKLLHCQHVCNDPCAVGHQCVCTRPCRQVCDHGRCDLGCASSCAPCAEKCTWICEHQVCLVSCGSPCTRLPCDKRCWNVLECGHSCPSLCGEPCNLQICPLCATPDQKDQVVDMILSTTLGEINTDDPGLDNILITLPCKHAFTVETLDGVCSLRDYYQHQDDVWVKPAVPPPGLILSPVCPQCRGDISSPRYGRVLKRCNLDLLERSIATETAESLRAMSNALEALDVPKIEQRLLACPRLEPSSQTDAARLLVIQGAYQDRLSIYTNASLPFKPAEYFSYGLHKDLGINRDLVDAWWKSLTDIYRLYESLYQVSCKQSPHRIAYENALSTLYRHELGRLAPTPASLQQSVQNALKYAQIAIGMTPPIADKRFQVESIWMAIDLRLKMASIAASLQANLAKEERDSAPMLMRMLGWISSDSNSHRQGEMIELFVQFIYDSCQGDAKLALRIAEASGAHRQVLKSELKLLRIELERFNFKVRLLEGLSASKATEKRQELAKMGNAKHSETASSSRRAVEAYYKSKGKDEAEVDWVQESFLETVTIILEEWVKIVASLRRGTFYQPVSIEEKRQIQQAFGFTNRGHWYRCPNGHAFVITECGGAMAVGRCVECNAPIGGGNHTLLSTNTRDTEFEEIARAQGVAPSPWRWAAGA